MMLKIVFVVILVGYCYCKQVAEPSIVLKSSYKPHESSKSKGKGFVTTTVDLAVADSSTKCTTRSAGWTTLSSLGLQAGLAEGQKSVSLDVTIPGLACKHVGLKATACDKELEPLVMISKDMNTIDIFRNGNSTEEIKVDVLLQCKEPLKLWVKKNNLRENPQNNLVDLFNIDSYERKFNPVPGFD